MSAVTGSGVSGPLDGPIDVSICICTFRRPDGLLRLLRSLRGLDPTTPPHEIIVVDNDADAAGAVAVEQARREGMVLQYLIEPQRSIARARNRSVRAARADYVAFIDDDEEAEPRWLLELWQQMHAHGADGAIGPVIPRFHATTPQWMIDGRFFERPRRPTGTLLDAKGMRTGNALIRRQLLTARESPFDERFDLTGAEDTELFMSLVDAGGRFIAVDSAIVHEYLSESRTRAVYLLRRRFLGSLNLSKLLRPPEQPAHIESWRGAQAAARALGWGAVGMVCFPVAPIYGLDRLSLAARQLGEVASLFDISYRPYLRDSWR